MKKLKYFILGLFLIIPFNVMAVSSTITISCPDSASRLATVSCVIRSSTTGGNLNGVSASYDFSSGLTFSSFTPASIWTSYVNSSSGFAIGNTSGVSSGATIGTLNVKLSNVTPGSNYRVSLAGISLSDTSYTDVTYTLISDIIRVKSNDNKLSSLTVSNGTISFNENTTTYNLTVDSSSTYISAKSSSSSASVSGTGTKTLKYGLNTFKINVTAESGSVRTYTLNITRPDNRSSNNKLSSLTLSSGTLNFDSNVTSYNVDVNEKVSKVDIKASLADSKASFVSGYGPREVNLSFGVNTFNIIVKSERGVKRTYKLNITRKDSRSGNNKLSSLTLSNGKVDFDPDKTLYNVRVSKDVKKVVINAELADSKAKFVSGYAPRIVTLNDGANQFKIIVKSERGVTRTYVINITKDDGRSDNAYLKSLALSAGGITFNKEVYEYDVNVENDVDVLDIEALADDEKAKIDYVKSNKLEVGDNKIVIKVTAENDKKLEYVLNVTRKEEGAVLDNNSILKSLRIEGVYVDLKSDVFEYEFKSNKKKLDIDCVTLSDKASVKIFDNNDLKDKDVITILVTAEDMSTSTYKITVLHGGNTILIAAGLVCLVLITIGVIYIIKFRGKSKNISALDLSGNNSQMGQNIMTSNDSQSFETISKIDSSLVEDNAATDNSSNFSEMENSAQSNNMIPDMNAYMEQNILENINSDSTFVDNDVTASNEMQGFIPKVDVYQLENSNDNIRNTVNNNISSDQNDEIL